MLLSRQELIELRMTLNRDHDTRRRAQGIFCQRSSRGARSRDLWAANLMSAHDCRQTGGPPPRNASQVRGRALTTAQHAFFPQKWVKTASKFALLLHLCQQKGTPQKSRKLRKNRKPPNEPTANRCNMLLRRDMHDVVR
jgi:hypothetical protein